MPMLGDGNVQGYVVVPKKLMMAEVQRRVFYRVCALDEDTWMTHQARLPRQIRDAVLESDAMRQRGVILATLARGGVPRNRQGMQPRSVMMGWALDRTDEACPSIPHATASMLMRAKQRTIMGVLNARSDIQVAGVMEAALRRASINHAQLSPRQEQEQAHDEELHRIFREQSDAATASLRLHSPQLRSTP